MNGKEPEWNSKIMSDRNIEQQHTGFYNATTDILENKKKLWNLKSFPYYYFTDKVLQKVIEGKIDRKKLINLLKEENPSDFNNALFKDDPDGSANAQIDKEIVYFISKDNERQAPFEKIGKRITAVPWFFAGRDSVIEELEKEDNEDVSFQPNTEATTEIMPPPLKEVNPPLQDSNNAFWEHVLSTQTPEEKLLKEQTPSTKSKSVKQKLLPRFILNRHPSTGGKKFKSKRLKRLKTRRHSRLRSRSRIRR